jgi:hypothetical protein
MQFFVNQAPVFQPSGIKMPTSVQLLEEQCLFSCSLTAIEMYAGPIVKDAVDRICQLYEVPIRRGINHGLSAVVDVRVHRLFPGQFPGIPGWHCDFVPRGAYSGQPNFALVHPDAFHVALLLSDQQAGVSNTQFVESAIRPQIFDQEAVYANLHHEVDRIGPALVTANDGQFVWFNQKSIHRAMPAHRRGTRLFLRFSMVEKPVIANGRPKQMQVYQLSEAQGW